MNDPKTVSKHLTKASAHTAASSREVKRQYEGHSSGHARVRYKVVPSGNLFRRWKVIEV